MATLLDDAATRINAGQDYTILIVGDSTTIANWFYDGPIGSPYGNGLGGWAGRLGINIGKWLGCAVTYQTIGPLIALIPPSASPVVWTNTVASWPPSGESWPITKTGVVRVINSGVDASTMQYHLSQMPDAGGHLMDDHGQNIIIVGHGINGTGISSGNGNYYGPDYISEMDDFVTQAKTAFPSIKIVFTTQNPTGTIGAAPAPEELSRIGLYNALAADYIATGKHLSLTPALQKATKYTNVFVLDTRQAYVGYTAYMTDGLHPNAYGFSLQADFMLNQMTTIDVATEEVVPSPPIVTLPVLLPTMVVGQDFSQTFAATGATPRWWSVSAGLLPMGLNLSSDGGVLSGNPTFPGDYDFTICATNAYGYGESRYTGTVTLSYGPFNPNGLAKPKVLVGGSYYSITANPQGWRWTTRCT